MRGGLLPVVERAARTTLESETSLALRPGDAWLMFLFCQSARWSAPVKPSGEIGRLQALRFFAAGIVLVRHVFMEMDQHDLHVAGQDQWLDIPWGAGVDIFFVISGFIIFYGSGDKTAGGPSASDFFVRRLIRLWPTYALFSLLMLAAVLLAPSFLERSTLDGSFVAASFAFIPWPRPDDGAYYPLLGQGWTLNYEMFFYTCFALVLLAPPRFRVSALIAGGATLVVAGLLLPLPQPLAYYADPIILEFLFGVGIGVAYRRRAWVSPRAGLFAIAVGFTALYLMKTQDAIAIHRVVAAGIPAALIVGGVLVLGRTGERVLGGRRLVTLGNASYAFYLSHTFVVNVCLLAWLKLHLGAPWVFFWFATLASVLASVVVYLLIEKPLLGAIQNRYFDLRMRRRARVTT